MNEIESMDRTITQVESNVLKKYKPFEIPDHIPDELREEINELVEGTWFYVEENKDGTWSFLIGWNAEPNPIWEEMGLIR